MTQGDRDELQAASAVIALLLVVGFAVISLIAYGVWLFGILGGK